MPKVPTDSERIRFQPQYLEHFANGDIFRHPRIIHIPVSGGDRKSLAENIRRAQQLCDAKMAQAEAAQRVADAKLLEARIARCEAWNAAMLMGGPAQPSPSIEDALASGFELLEVRCNKCGRTERLRLADVRRKRCTPLWMEAALGCEPCRITTKWKTKAHIVGLLRSRPPSREPPARVSKNR